MSLGQVADFRTDVLPDSFTGEFRVPVISDSRLIPTGYPQDIMRRITPERISTGIDFQRSQDADGVVITIELQLAATILGFEYAGKTLMLPQPTSGLKTVARAVTELFAKDHNGIWISIFPVNFYAKDYVGEVKEISWVELVREGMVRTVYPAWILASTNGEGE